MEKTIKVAHYFRGNYRAKAVIYVRGNNKEFQEMMCRLYAIEKGYEVAYVTRHLEDVNLCDVLLVASPSRISRDKDEYYKVVKEFDKRGIKVENAIDADNVNDNISFLMNGMLNKKDNKVEKG